MIKTDGENNSIEELNKEAQEFFLSNTMNEIKEELNETNKSSGLRMFKTKDGGTATFCFHFR